MPSFDKIAADYAERIKAAVVRDRGIEDFFADVRIAGKPVLPWRENLSAEIQKIIDELSGLVYTKSIAGVPGGTQKEATTPEALTAADKEAIAEKTARQLGLSHPNEYKWFVKGGSNEALMQLAQQIENLFQQLRNKS